MRSIVVLVVLVTLAHNVVGLTQVASVTCPAEGGKASSVTLWDGGSTDNVYPLASRAMYQVGYSTLHPANISCYGAADTTKLPPYLLSLSLGLRKFDNVNGLRKSIAIIPQANPKTLRVYSYVSSWELKWELYITTNLFADWVGIVADNTESSKISRIFVYSASTVVPIDISQPMVVLYPETDLNALSGGFLSNPMTQITSWVFVDEYTMYVTRAGSSFADPGEIMMFDPKTFKYYKSVYLQHAPTKMFTWKQAWGDALYWVTRGNSSDSSYLWFWDLKNHIGDSTPTYLQISATGCMDIGPSIFTQLLGQYAAIPLVACAGANPIGGYVILELFASHGTRAITSINKVNTQKQLRLGISLPALRSSGFLTIEQDSTPEITYRLFKFDDPDLNEAKFRLDQSSQAQKSSIKSNFAPIPPFCSASKCGPDSATPDCPTGAKCVFLSGVSNWVCCTRSPFGF